jgi:hypothetical protein
LKTNKAWKRNLLVLILLASAISMISIGVFAAYALQSNTALLEVEEPLELLSYPIAFSLFPGETKEFTVTVQNAASINYSVTLLCSLNDTEYQAKYVVFSSENYTVNPGTHTLVAWLTVSSDAPAGNFLLSVNLTRSNLDSDEPSTSPSPTPPSSGTPSPTTNPTSNPTPAPSTSPSPSPVADGALTPCALLLEGGAKWAANNRGGSALFINSKDNWAAHHLTDGADWGPWPSESAMDQTRASVAQSISRAGFEVHFAGDVPQSLSGFDLVVVEAYYAVEPKHRALFQDYIANGGGVVILGGVPCYFSVYCKDLWPYKAGEWPTGPGGTDLTSLQDWFGCRYYVNTGGTARVTIDNPFGTGIVANSTIVTSQSYSAAAVSTPSNSTQVIASWDPLDSWGQGAIFAFTHEYGQGRVYYQASY